MPFMRMDILTRSVVSQFGRRPTAIGQLADRLAHCFGVRYTRRMGTTRGHNELAGWLKRAELTGAQLAQLSGLAPMQIYHILSGRRRASLEVAVRIDEATRGAVPCRLWLEPA